MRRDVHHALESHADEYTVVRELHTVPPHAVYEVILEGRRAICKLARGPQADPATEAQVIQYVSRETSIPVPSVIAVGDGHFVAEWHDGAPGGIGGEPDDPTLHPETARTMGAGLATLHAETDFPQTGLFDVEADDITPEGDDSWPDTLRALVTDCRSVLEPYGYGDVATAVAEFLRDRPGVLEGVGSPVLVHGNFLREHVGLEDAEVTCVIDFEHAFAGDGEYDYWATALPTFGTPELSVDAEGLAAFREGYESIRSLRPGFDRRGRLYRLVLTVTYLRSLYLQRAWESRADADDRAETMAAFARSELESLRDRSA